MGLIIDVISLFVLIMFICLGYKKGLIKSVMGLVSVILSLIVAINFFHVPSAYIRANVIEPYFSNETSKTFSSLMNGGTEVIPIEKVFEDEPDALSETAEKFGIDVDEIKEYYNTAIKGIVDSFDTKTIADKLSGFVVDSVSDTVSNVLGFLATFLASLLILTVLIWIINLIFKLPALNFTNKLAGALLGVVKAFVLIVIVTNVALDLVSAIGNNTDQTDGVDKFWSKQAAESSVSYTLVENAGLLF
ncbi:MAG: CvpA family protein [Ruminococcaceae bacterium]|nr:CvpA family protein [Oscillospiraceae bacterium]